VDDELPVECLLQDVNVKLHLYGKQGAKPGRKMGHFNVLAEHVDDAKQHAVSVYKKLMSH
jgi:5-(carboxyamino)imidazole ribonucleotide synthase